MDKSELDETIKLYEDIFVVERLESLTLEIKIVIGKYRIKVTETVVKDSKEEPDYIAM